MHAASQPHRSRPKAACEGGCLGIWAAPHSSHIPFRTTSTRFANPWTSRDRPIDDQCWSPSSRFLRASRPSAIALVPVKADHAYANANAGSSLLITVQIESALDQRGGGIHDLFPHGRTCLNAIAQRKGRRRCFGASRRSSRDVREGSGRDAEAEGYDGQPRGEQLERGIL